MAFVSLGWLLSQFKAVCFWIVTFLFLVKFTTKEQTHTNMFQGQAEYWILRLQLWHFILISCAKWNTTLLSTDQIFKKCLILTKMFFRLLFSFLISFLNSFESSDIATDCASWIFFLFFPVLQNKPHRYTLLVNKEPFIQFGHVLWKTLLHYVAFTFNLAQVSVAYVVLHVKGDIADWFGDSSLEILRAEYKWMVVCGEAAS